MGVFQPCPNIAEFQMVYGVNGENCENVYHIHSDTGWDATALNATCLVLVAWETASARGSRHSLCALFKILATDLTSEAGADLFFTPAAPVVGLDVSGPLPNNATIAIKAGTGLRGRSFRGRSYWNGLSINQVTGNDIQASAATALQVAMNDLMARVNAEVGHQLVVLSRRHNNAARAAGVGTPVIGYTLADLALDSQRRRLQNHNRHH